MHTLYHITPSSLARQAEADGYYEPPDYAREGFIHCSFLHQVVGVGDRLYRHLSDLVVLEIDLALLNCDVVVENLEGGSVQFPHIYGRLRMSAVVAVYELPRTSDGGFALPKPLRDER